MSMFKIILKYNDKEEVELGTFTNKEDAINESFKLVSNTGAICCLDNDTDCKQALMDRGYYLLGQSPREVIIEENV